MAAIWKWRDNPDVIAHLIPEKAIKGIFKRDVVLNPGEAALLIRNGKLEDVVTQTRLKKIGGGLGNWWARWRGHESGTELLFLITTPIDLEIPLDDRTGLTTKDYQKMYGKTTIRFQFLQENVPKIINLMERKPLLTKARLIRRIQEELIAMVFSGHIAKYNADEFQGNVSIIKDMETAAGVEMRKTFGLWGLHFLKMYTVWGKGAYDDLMQYKAQLKNIYEKRTAYTDIQFDEKLHLLDKDHEVRKKEQEHKWDLQFGEIDSEEKVKDIHWDADIGRDERKFESKLDMDKKQFEVELDQDQRELEMALAAKQRMQEMKMARLQKETDLKMTEKQQDLDFKSQQMAMQTSSAEKVMEKAIETGAADSNAIQEMLRQQSIQKALDRETEKVEALTDADKARYNMDTYQAAEDRERDQQLKVMDSSAKLMEAAKQKLPETLVQGASSTPVVTHITPPPQQTTDKKETEDCWNCGEAVEKGLGKCPHCGEGLE